MTSASDVAFNSEGLVPVVVQDASTKRVLMLAYMNRAALELTLTTGRAVYWSRSRAELWRKGDTSGNAQYIRRVELDCDGDTILLTVEQVGPACHTGATSCFDVARLPAVIDLEHGDSGPPLVKE